VRLLLRIVGVLAAVSVMATLWFIAAFAGVGGRSLVSSRLLGALTIVGWVVAIVVGQ